LSRDILSDVVVYNKYAKHTGQRRETWPEICTRSAAMFAKEYPDLEAEIYQIFGTYVMEKKVVPSMRCLQFAGKPIELSPNRLFNCAFMNMNHYRAFPETMFMLLGGSGVGFSVQRRHVDALPYIQPPLATARYVVQDSITGWADAVKTLVKAYYGMGPRPRFDFSDIREKGSALVTTGGKAPGPAPLKAALEAIEDIFFQKDYGERLSSIEVFDIQCHIAQAVLSGGVRRSATICLFDADDDAMLTAKYGQWWQDNPQRAMANISAVIDKNKGGQRDAYDKIFRILQDSGSGEPGFAFMQDLDMGYNPLTIAA
jgi:ribonucleoside-triphosphate reductase